MKCPNCGTEGPEQAAECGSCGANFEKLRRLAESRAQASSAPPAPGSGGAGWMLALAAAAAGALGYFQLRPSPAPAAPEAVEAANPTPAASAEINMIPDGGYERVQPLWDAVLAGAAAENVSISQHELRGPFDSGFRDMDYAFLNSLTPEETGLPRIPLLQGHSSEKGGLKCRKDGWDYLERHPEGTDGYEECCRRNTKSKTTATDMGTSVLLMTKPDGYADTWSCYRWQPRRRTWSPYGEEELVRGYEFYANKKWGPIQQQVNSSKASGSDPKQRIFQRHWTELHYEGAMYRVELEKKRLAAAGSP